ncbi:MAG TPA: PKD domain-containing protein [Bacteroidetes bacterium]|nr:PKD domain-containing protein [Bacteroidota bacterium]
MTDLEIAGNGDLYAGINSGGIYKSAASLGAQQGDAGQWTRLTGLNLPGGYDRVEVAVGKSNSNYVYAVAEVNQGTSNYYRSTNGGSTWSITSSQPNGGGDHSNGQAWYDLCLEVDPGNHLRLYTGAIDQWRTANGGASWSRLTAAYSSAAPYMHPDQHVIVPNPAVPTRVLFGNDGGVHYSSNRGSNPSSRNRGYNVTQFYSLAISTKPGSPRIIGGTQDNGTKMLTSNGLGASVDLTGGDGAYTAINPDDPDTMFTASQWETLYRTRNGGNTFNYIANPALGDNNTMFINPFEIDPINPNVIYQASTTLWRHPNANSGGSGSWRRVTINMGSLISAITPSKTIANTVYFATGGTLYRLSNTIFANQTSVPTTVNPSGLGTGYINCILDDPADGNHLIIPFSSYGLNRHVVEVIDADLGSGASYRNLSGNLPDIPCNWVAFEPNNPKGLLVATDMGVFRCADYTVAEADIYWAPASLGLGWPRVEQIKTRYSDNSVHLATHGRGFFSTYTYSLPPSAAFAPAAGPACGGYVSFIDSSSNAPTAWTWDFGDGGSSNLQSPMHQYTTSGNYNVTMIVTNPNGSDTVSSQISVTVLPTVIANAGLDQAGCPGDTLYFNATGGATYSWFPIAGLSDPNIATPYVVVSGNRSYVVTVTDLNGCVGTDTLQLSQLSVPSLWAGQDQTIMFPNDSVQLMGSGADNYVWSPATGLSCTACPNPKALPATTTVYTCTGSNLNGCSLTDNVTVTVAIVGLENGLPNSRAGLGAVSPNPVKDRARLSYQLASPGEISLDLVDLRGKTVAHIFSGFVDAGTHTLSWERDRGIAAGLYFLRLRAEGALFVQRMLIAE